MESDFDRLLKGYQPLESDHRGYSSGALNTLLPDLPPELLTFFSREKVAELLGGVREIRMDLLADSQGRAYEKISTQLTTPGYKDTPEGQLLSKLDQLSVLLFNRLAARSTDEVELTPDQVAEYYQIFARFTHDSDAFYHNSRNKREIYFGRTFNDDSRPSDPVGKYGLMRKGYVELFNRAQQLRRNSTLRDEMDFHHDERQELIEGEK